MAFIDLMYMWEMKKGPKLAPSLTVGSEIPKANGLRFLKSSVTISYVI